MPEAAYRPEWLGIHRLQFIGHDLQQKARIHRFCQVPVEPGLESGIAIVVAAVTGERQQLRPSPGQREAFADGVRHHVAVHARQADVEQHDIRAKILELRKSRGAVVHHFHVMTIGA